MPTIEILDVYRHQHFGTQRASYVSMTYPIAFLLYYNLHAENDSILAEMENGQLAIIPLSWGRTRQRLAMYRATH